MRQKSWAIEDESGILKSDLKEVAEVWKSYCQNLYSGNASQDDTGDSYTNSKELYILKEEIRTAVIKLKNNKAAGPDGITTEILQATGGVGIDMLHQLYNKIWHTRRWPKDWTRCSVLTIHKKGSITKCNTGL